MFSPDWSRLRFRDITIADGYTVCRWRNSASAREAFFDTTVVTPDTHAAFVRSRKPHDLVWMLEEKATDTAIGMLSLTVDPTARTAEYGRAFLDEAYRGRGFWQEAEFLLLHFAFDVLALDAVWLDIYADNDAMNAVHAKMGWTINGHIPPRNGRDVLRMTYAAATWAANKAALYQRAAQPIINEAMG